jgi:hypothetical protein
VSLLNVLTTAGPCRIKKNAPQNNPTEAFTKRLSHEFRNKIETPRAMSVMLSVKSFLGACDSALEPALAKVVFISKLNY